MKKLFTSAAIMLAISAPVLASTYGSVSYGTATVQANGVSFNHGAVRGIVGLDVTPNIAVEGHAVIGTGSASTVVKLDSSFGAFVKGTHNVSEKVDVFARAGYVRNNVVFPILGARGHESGMAYGVGVNYAVSKNSAVAVDYTQLYNKRGVRLNTVMAGYTFRF